MGKLAIVNGRFLTMQAEQAEFTGTMLVENGKISKLTTETMSKDQLLDYEIVDGRHRLYMPGFVNTHGHTPMSLLRGHADDMALQVWLQEKIWPNEANFTAQDIYAGTMLSLVEMIKGGTTSFVDMYDFMDEVARAVEQAGLRGSLTRGIIGFGTEKELAAKLNDAKEFAKRWHGQAEGRITTMMAPHAPYTCSPDYIRQIVEAAHELDLPIHIHLSETAREVAENVEQYGARPPAHLRDLGVFSRPTLLAHAVHLNDEEIAMLAEYDVRVSHNPGSNLKLASGVARVPELLAAGVKVSLGTDGAASNNNLDMLEEIRLAALLHKGVSGDPTAVPAMEALRMGTVYGAQSIWLEQVGMLKQGDRADFIAINIDQPHLYPYTSFASHMAYSASGADVTDVWVEGRCLMRNRQLQTVDEEKVIATFNESFQRLKLK